LRLIVALETVANKGFIEIVYANCQKEFDIKSVYLYCVVMISILHNIVASLLFEIGKYIKTWLSRERITLYIYTDIPLPGRNKYIEIEKGKYMYTIKVPR